MTDKELCIKCGHKCCHWIGFTTSEMSGRSLEFYIARGCKILAADMDGTRIYRVYVPNICINLIEGDGCSIYNRRPLACISYSGREDPLMQDVCLINE